METTVVLMVKSPILGGVKTRLARVIGDRGALDIYRFCVKDMVETLETSQVPYIIAYTPEVDLPDLDKWLKLPKLYMAQKGKDLGERLGNVFATCFSEEDCGVIALNSDTPDLPPSILIEAVSSLATQEAIIGPCTDGGYYAIGFRRNSYIPEIFENIPWSTETVFEETFDILSEHGLDTHVLPTWRDLDTYDDLKDYVMKERRRWGRWTRKRAVEIVKFQENADNNGY